MLSPNAAFQLAIAEDKIKVAEIYDFLLANGDTHRFTSHSKDIIWNAAGDTYTALTPLERGPIENNINLEVDVVEIRLGNISGDLFDLVQKNTLNNIKVTIRRILWDQPYAADMQVVYFIGLGDISFDRKELVVSCRTILDSLNIQVPKHVFQEPCNHRLYSNSCTLVQSEFGYTGVVATGDRLSFTDAVRGTVYKGIFDNAANTLTKGDTITGSINGYTAVVVQVVYSSATAGFIWYVELNNSANFENDEILSSGGNTATLNGTPVEDTSFYPQGEVKVTSGNNSGERRQIIRNAGNETTLQWPFPNDLEVGDTYIIYPGCDKTAAAACQNKFGNAQNFRGFLYGPKPEDTFT